MEDLLFYLHRRNCPWQDRKGKCKGLAKNQYETKNTHTACDASNCPIKFWLDVLQRLE